MLLSLCHSRLCFFSCLSSFSGRRHKERSLSACDRGRDILAPRREGRRVGSGGNRPKNRNFQEPQCRSLVKYVPFLVTFLKFVYRFVSEFGTSRWAHKTMDGLRMRWETSRNYMHRYCSLSFVFRGLWRSSVRIFSVVREAGKHHWCTPSLAHASTAKRRQQSST